MIRKASAVWQGTGKDGTGQLTSDSGVLSSTPYSFKTRFENEKGTNPGGADRRRPCRAASRWRLPSSCRAPASRRRSLSTEAAVSLVQDGGGFTIDKSTLTLAAKVPGIDKAKFEELARAAEKNCPVSKVLNAEITMGFTLA